MTTRNRSLNGSRNNARAADGSGDHLLSLLNASARAIAAKTALTADEPEISDAVFHELTTDARFNGFVSEIGAAADDAASERFNVVRNALRFIDDAAIESLPIPEQAIEGIYPVGGLVVVFGPSGKGKTFVLLSMAFAHATGTCWMGRRVKAGCVIYVAAEGSAGLGARVRAWKRANRYTGRAGVYFVTEPVRLMEGESVQRFLSSIDLHLGPVRPVAIIFDTLARNMVGGDENSAKDMGEFIDGADRIRHATGATVIVVHHTGVNGERERGSTSLRGAADTSISLAPKDDVLFLTCEKQKDASPFEPIALELHNDGDSCVVITPKKSLELSTQSLTPSERKALQTLQDSFLVDGATATEWSTASGLPQSSFFAVRTALCNKGFASVSKPGRGARYTVSEKGKSALTPNSNFTPNSLQQAPSNHSTPKGGPFREGTPWSKENLEEQTELENGEGINDGDGLPVLSVLGEDGNE